jgi:cyclomaltodextrinase / maltogenic alpha-amylase / neopullulanase
MIKSIYAGAVYWLESKPDMNRIFKARRMITLAAAGLLGAALLVQAAGVSTLPARTSPAWLRDGVIYEIFPRDFSAAGDLNGVTAQLDRLKKLGVTILWTMPIQPIGEKGRKGTFGSPYSVRDYYAVDPNYGTLDDYKRLVSEAHQRGMKVIMDVVPNHTAWDCVLMQHPEYYKQDAKGKIIPPEPEWSDVAGLNFANADLRAYMIGVFEYWIKTCDVDGFRCDVAYMPPTDFWNQARAALDKTKPDIIMLAEASKPDLLTNAFDIDYSWPLLGTLNKVLLHGAPASDLQASWEQSLREFPSNSLHLRISDDHDESRAVSRFGIEGALAASAFMFSLDGVPLIYNGMEVGDATESGDPALFEKLPIFWSPKARPPLSEIYHGLIGLRRQYPAFCNQRVVWLQNSDPGDLATLMRSDDHDEFVVVVNFSNRPVNGRVQVPNDKDFKPVPVSGMPKIPDGDFPDMHLGGFEWRIYHRAVPK